MRTVHRVLLATAMLLPLGAMSKPPALFHTQTTPGSPESLADAATRFTQRIAVIDKSGAPVTALRAPADAALLRAAFDSDVVRALPNDPGVVFAACQPVSTAYQALTGFVLKPRAGSNTRAQILVVQDQLVTALLAGDLCSKRLLRVSGPFITGLSVGERTAARRDGVKMMQTGAQQILRGTLMVQADPRITDANRARMIAGMFEDIDIVAEAISPGDRAKVRVQILDFAERAKPATKAALVRLARAFERSDCGTICSFAGG